MRTKCPKKTIVSSKYQSQCCPRPENTTTCWSRRNDSTNVCSALQNSTPDDSECEDRCFSEGDEDEEPRRLMIFSKSRPPHPVCKKGCASCYCNAVPVEPLFKCDDKVDHCACQTAIKPLPCNNSDVHSVFLKYSPPSRKRAVFDTYTKRRQNYENYSANYFLDLKSQLAKLEEEMQEDRKCNKSISSKQEYKCRKSTNCKERPKTAEVTKDLIDFRTNNFFVCHSSEITLDKPTPEHRCEHDFTLNDRLQAIPKNPDVFGVSRCKTCSKPISTHVLSNMTSKKPSSASNKSSRGSSMCSLRLPSRASSSRQGCSDSAKNSNSSACSQKRLVYDLGRECFNFDIPKTFYKDLEQSLKVPCYRKPPPTNSMALRFQKGIY